MNLPEGSALEQAEASCLADADIRERRRLRTEARRMAEDVELRTAFAREIARLFPRCPAERAEAIARHSGVRGTGRVGRTEAGQALDPGAVTLAVTASVRHEDTPYDELLMSGLGRSEARDRVRAQVEAVLDQWRGSR